MKYKIINSGSDGNCIILNDEIMLDCGVSFKRIKDDYKKIKLVCISHEHSDHFSEKTIKKLAFERPTLRFCIGEFLLDKLLKCGVNEKNIDVIKLNTKIKYKRFLYTSN